MPHFNSYPPFANQDEINIYESLFERFRNRIPSHEQNGINTLLNPLRYKSEVHYFHWRHSVRVAYLTVNIACLKNMDPKPALYAGLLHDCGKALVPISLLGKTKDWSEEDSIAIQTHVIDGYRLVAGWFDFSARIMLWHHRFQSNPYPELMPPAIHQYSQETLVSIEEYGRILALADSYDALHRVSNTGNGTVSRTGDEIRELMKIQNQDQLALVEDLYTHGIFTTLVA